MREQKTIFISSFHPYISRNVLSTDAFSMLAENQNIRLVLFVPEHKKDFFEKRFGRENVMVEGVPFGAASKKYSALIMKRLAKFGLDSHSTSIERRIKWKREGKFWYFLLATAVAKLLTNIRTLRFLLRRIDMVIAAPYRFADYFKTYQPDAVLITDMQNERDVELAQNARHFKIPVCGMVRSWDNLTIHGILRMIPEKLLVPSRRLKEEAIAIHDVPEKSIEVVGISHYDKYAKGPKISREEFMCLHNFNPAKKLIFCTVIGDSYIPKNTTDPYVLKLLSGIDANVIVRFSPTVRVKELESATPYPNMRFDRPGISFSETSIRDQELSDKDDDNLMHGLMHADVVVCGPSTIALDAAFFDKPTVLTGAFHPYPRKYLEGAHRYDYNHFRAAVSCNAVMVPKSEEEFLHAIGAYIKNPALDAEGRARFRDAYCDLRDGKSGERIAKTVLESLSH